MSRGTAISKSPDRRCRGSVLCQSVLFQVGLGFIAVGLVVVGLQVAASVQIA